MSRFARAFEIGQRVRHLASGSIYRIVDVPPRLRIAATGELAYSYTLANSADITLWVSCQANFENGQFVADGGPDAARST